MAGNRIDDPLGEPAPAGTSPVPSIPEPSIAVPPRVQGRSHDGWGAFWDMAGWPSEVLDGLIPVEVVRAEGPVPWPWTGVPLFWDPVGYPFIPPVPKGTPHKHPFTGSYRHSQYFPHAYLVTLRVADRDVRALRLPQLLNLLQAIPSANAYHLNFHAVYLHERDWRDFSFIHASDTHVAWRNDFMALVILDATGREPSDFINFNQEFRNLIGCANQMHRAGNLDFILLTGDLVDHVTVERRFDEHGNFGFPGDNFTVLRNLVVGWRFLASAVVGQELEVPLFTVLGNHDYRPSEYPLIAHYETEGNVIQLYESDESRTFHLTRDEALAYESGPSRNMPHYGPGDGIDDQSTWYDPPSRYRALLNPDADFTIPLGRHRIVCLDSGPDKGVFTGQWDALTWYDTTVPVDSRYDRKHTTPDGVGFSDEQIRFLQTQVEDADGLVIVACHDPIINYRRVPPPHLFRESEHSVLSGDDVADLRRILYADEFSGYAIELEKMPLFFFNPDALGDPWGGAPSLYDVDQSPDWARPFFEYWLRESGYWSGEATAYFKRGGREPDLGRGVPDANFDPFFEAITRRMRRKKNIDLALAGHTHRSVEYRAGWIGDRLGFWHDYYFDGTVHGRSPSEFWTNPEGLFSVEGRAYGELGQGGGGSDTTPVPWWLREAFESRKHPLTPQAYVRVEEPGRRWTIVDPGFPCYCVSRGDGERLDVGLLKTNYPAWLAGYWNRQLPRYPYPLNESTDPGAWWEHHGPLFVQTLSATAPPPPTREVGFLHLVVRNDVIVRVNRVTFQVQRSSWPAPEPEAENPYFVLACSPP